ncbi:MAG: VWA domain-containing protein [Bryobacterales bacterium]|nr:VWA domain-containing protein [Bryobacteraceae bacterium]MDW8129817.1 VWA domain-containing protein [Bryobacterales bacterium]
MRWQLAVAALLAASVAAGQQPRSRGGDAPSGAQALQLDDEKTRIVLDVTRVNILFTVTDRKGRFITNLTKDDFEVYEDKRPQKILEFTAETDLPLRIALLLDTSNSVRPRFRFIQEAAIEFLNSVMRPRYDKALVVSFDTTVELVSDLTEDAEKLAAAIRELRPGGGTSLYDAIYFACRDKLAQEQPRHKFRRAVVVLSDGEDNQSRVTREQALEMAQKADAVIYTISTNITRVDTDGDKVLRYLASETGGLALFPFKIEDLTQSFENIANELRHQYNIFYRPEPLRTDGRYQAVDVRVKGRRDLVVRARKGYYAPRL